MWFYRIDWVDPDGDIITTAVSGPDYPTKNEALTAGRQHTANVTYFGLTPFILARQSTG